MKKEEYEKKLIDMEERHRKEELALKKEFAFSNSLIKKGDIISDKIKTIRVDSIRYTTLGLPECVYDGVLITKAGKPYKSGETGRIFHHGLLQDT